MIIGELISVNQLSNLYFLLPATYFSRWFMLCFELSPLHIYCCFGPPFGTCGYKLDKLALIYCVGHRLVSRRTAIYIAPNLKSIEEHA